MLADSVWAAWAAWAGDADAVPAITAPAAAVPEYPIKDRLEMLLITPPHCPAAGCFPRPPLDRKRM
ncbi:hypothetical protein Srubr_24540 [Streptomyces rubradiris]|uniref:Uncharacterized protein n=1 Tax=Streptomyces rubradiris TaxID=285531 RepID=A0ABQ3R9T1_STRRR|nr:hypothetical protein GCM10018792_15090 [Streptomyces rubradiris]GHI52608.1 hypothetical protein Srubr_24540 [Streptomyces rubradiris]